MMKKLKISSGNNFHYIEKQLNVINNAGFSEIKTTFRNEKIDFDLFVKLKMYSIFSQLISSLVYLILFYFYLIRYFWIKYNFQVFFVEES